MKGRQQGTNIAAATDRLKRVGCGFLAQPFLQLLPHVLGGSGQGLGVGLFRAELGDRLIQPRVLLRSKKIHDAPFLSPRRLFFSRARVRWSVTATTACEDRKSKRLNSS